MTIMGATTVIMERLMVLVKANEMVLCRRIQIIRPHKIQILAIIIRVNMIITHMVINFESHMQGLGLTSGQRLVSTNTGVSAYHRDNYDDDFMTYRNLM